MKNKRDWIFQKDIEDLEKILKIDLNDKQKDKIDSWLLGLQEEIEECYADNRDTEPNWDMNDLD